MKNRLENDFKPIEEMPKKIQKVLLLPDASGGFARKLLHGLTEYLLLKSPWAYHKQYGLK